MSPPQGNGVGTTETEETADDREERDDVRSQLIGKVYNIFISQNKSY